MIPYGSRYIRKEVSSLRRRHSKLWTFGFAYGRIRPTRNPRIQVFRAVHTRETGVVQLINEPEYGQGRWHAYSFRIALMTDVPV